MSDPNTVVVPVTIGVERGFPCRPGVLFDAFAEVDQRASWSVPVSEVVVFESSDFRIGGIDHFVQGRHDVPNIAGTVRYEHIVDGECIVFTQRLSNPDDRLISISLVTWSIAPSDAGARLSVTDQTSSVVGSRPIEGIRYRYEIMLDRLTDHLDSLRS